MEAVDANNVTGPGKGVTAVARIKIVTEEEKRAELAERMNDALGSLDEVSQSEDELADGWEVKYFEKPRESSDENPKSEMKLRNPKSRNPK